MGLESVGGQAGTRQRCPWPLAEPENTRSLASGLSVPFLKTCKSESALRSSSWGLQ